MSQVNQDNQLWRGLEGQESAAVVASFKHREFQEGASVLEDPISRRTFIKLLGATTALAGLTGCGLRKPERKIYPYAKMPEEILPGRSTFYSTSMAVGRQVAGLVVESHEGRPTKVEGNPSHADNLGKSNVVHQASVLELYDPDRLTHPKFNGKPSTWSDFESWVSSSDIFSNRGSRVAVLTDTSMSPSFHSAVDHFYTKYPRARVFRYDPVNSDSVIDGAELAFSRRLIPQYRFESADLVVSFADDFLSPALGRIADVKAYSSRRDPEHKDGMNRLFVLESSLSNTGAKADHRIRVKTANLDKAVLELAAQLVRDGLSVPSSYSSLFNVISSSVNLEHSVVPSRYLRAISADLLTHKGRSILTGGAFLGAASQGVLHVLNLLLGNLSSTVTYVLPAMSGSVVDAKSSAESLGELYSSISKDQVDTLFIIGGNPFYTAFSEYSLANVKGKVKNIIHLTLSENESSAASNWVLPQSHYLESWGDLLSDSGQYSVVQPLIRPMYDTKTAIEFLSLLRGVVTTDYKLLRHQFDLMRASVSWKEWLHNGVVSLRNSVVTPVLGASFVSRLKAAAKGSGNADELSVQVVLDNRLLDGRFSNSAWLQELPDFMTKLTWDNALLMGPKTAEDQGVKTEDVVVLKTAKASLELPVMVVPGYADGDMTLSLGYGRKTVGVIGEEVGFDATPIWSVSGPLKASIQKTDRTYHLVTTQHHGSMHGRPIFREANVEEYQKNPEFAKEMVEHPPLKSLWPERTYDAGYQWGMAIDLSKCTGCSACLVACQAENNIPIVGKDQVANGREMHWIRIDRYFEGSQSDPKVAQMPVTCMHCENAPCEQVCPVAATTHSKEGTNDMAYNRCIGTRYCADNCPVKVRRFNFFDYHQRNPQAVDKKKVHLFDYFKEPNKQTQKQFNPDVTVRMRGVMEKCTFCVQRIHQAKSMAKVKGRDLVDGDVVTACQQACPADAIVFGDIRNKDAEVTRQISKKRGYHLLAELNLKPRTTYLASIRNEHPDLIEHNQVEESSTSHARSEH